jgi:hypothetical protein
MLEGWKVHVNVMRHNGRGGRGITPLGAWRTISKEADCLSQLSLFSKASTCEQARRGRQPAALAPVLWAASGVGACAAGSASPMLPPLPPPPPRTLRSGGGGGGRLGFGCRRCGGGRRLRAAGAPAAGRQLLHSAGRKWQPNGRRPRNAVADHARLVTAHAEM